MPRSRREIISDVLRTEFASHPRAGALQEADIETLATAIDRAIKRGDDARLPEEGLPPQKLTSANSD